MESEAAKFQAAMDVLHVHPTSQERFNVLEEMVTRETLDWFLGGLQNGGRIVTNLCYADDIILLAPSEAELQELVDPLDWVSRKYSLLFNVDETKVVAINWSRWVRSRTLGSWLQKMVSVRRNSVPG